MAQLFKVIALDGQEYTNLSEETLRLWRDSGRINLDSMVAMEGANNWYPLRQMVETNPWNAPPVSKPPPGVAPPNPQQTLSSPVQPSPPANLRSGPELGSGSDDTHGSSPHPSRERYGKGDAAILLLLGGFIFLCAYGGSTQRNNYSERFLAAFIILMLIVVIFTLFRIKLSRMKSALGCGGVVILFVVIAAFLSGVQESMKKQSAQRKQAFERKAEPPAPLVRQLSPYTVGDTLSLLASQPFVEERCPPFTDPMILSQVMFKSEYPNLSEWVCITKYKPGYRCSPDRGVNGVLENYRLDQPEIALVTPTYKFKVDGRPAARADCHIMSKSTPPAIIGSLVVLSYGFPKNHYALQGGVIIILAADFRNQTLEKLEIERIISSLKPLQ